MMGKEFASISSHLLSPNKAALGKGSIVLSVGEFDGSMNLSSSPSMLSTTSRFHMSKRSTIIYNSQAFNVLVRLQGLQHYQISSSIILLISKFELYEQLLKMFHSFHYIGRYSFSNCTGSSHELNV
ncbi:hypothetical protein A4A49_59437 [Nicotiana attenuata]|uniref:Uncharacterized protein n=1 Tax=Nicotiana attenuata TaxID=49451 RepID=A0A1J6I326_NICAT|nr:hypothetical protein A4A49_41242 [Nicotiana attenuata]OIT30161.1 hypothetical protein A4A49_59437 [Nicotiana attenuata]